MTVIPFFVYPNLQTVFREVVAIIVVVIVIDIVGVIVRLTVAPDSE
jgi:hypothetical protein